MTRTCTITFADLRHLVSDRPPAMDGALLEQAVGYLDSGVVLAVSPGVLFDFLRPRDFLRPAQPLPPGFLKHMQQNDWRVDPERVRLDEIIPREEPLPRITPDVRPEREVLRAPRALRITIRWNPAIPILEQLAVLRQHWPFLQQHTSRALLARAGHAPDWVVGELSPSELGGLAEATERGGFTVNVEPLDEME